MAKIKAFISYCSEDSRKRDHLRAIIDSSNNIEAVIVDNRNKPTTQLSEKVIETIKECSCFIPIITERSINNQWVNQEVGFAKSLCIQNKIRIIPIVQDEIRNNLKGFIHNQMDLPYCYKGNDNAGTENKSFKKQCKILINELDYWETIVSSNPKYNIDANFNNIFIKGVNTNNRLELEATLNIENLNDKDILISEIELTINYNLLEIDEIKKDIIFKSIKYKTDNYYYLKYNSVEVKSNKIKQLSKLLFQADYIPQYKSEFRNSIDSKIKSLKSFPAIFTLHNGEKILTLIQLIKL